MSDDVPLKRQGLYPCEAEIARRLSQSERRWRHIARQLERDGLPPIDPLFGGRYWPAVVAFLDRRYGVLSDGAQRAILVSAGDDGEERWDAA